MEQSELHDLIKRCRQKDGDAFTRLVKYYQEDIFRLSFRLLGNKDEARDMVQETFIKIWLNLDKYNSDYSFTTWLYRVSCNVCYDRLRLLQHSPLFFPLRYPTI